jgi:anti-sigma B factor antagonist
MEIALKSKKGANVLELKGSLDIYTSLELKNHIEKNIETAKALIIDLEQVNYIDSSGIGTLIKGLNLAKGKNVPFIIANVQPTIEKVFKVAGLLNFFTILTKDEYKSKFPEI